jgi:hypothetical protein
MPVTLIITVAPVAGRPSLYAADLLHAPICASHEPLLAAARQLLADGWPPDAILVMRHAGSRHDALRARLDVAAELTVTETASDGRPRFRRWKASPYSRIEPPVPFSRRPVSDIAARSERIHAEATP